MRYFQLSALSYGSAIKILGLFLTINLLFSNSASYASFGSNLGSFNINGTSIQVYSNGSNGYASNTYNYINGTCTGMKWQCVELVNRTFYQAYSLNIRVGGQNAVDYFNNPNRNGIILEQYVNGGYECPKIGDALCFAGGISGYGHIGIIVEINVSQGYVRIANQNFYQDSRDISVQFPLTYNPITMRYTISVGPLGSRYSVQGWLRRPCSQTLSFTSPSINSVINGGNINMPTISLNWTNSGITGSVVSIQYSINGGYYQNIVDPTLNDGQHSWKPSGNFVPGYNTVSLKIYNTLKPSSTVSYRNFYIYYRIGYKIDSDSLATENYKLFSVYPNPTDGNFTVSVMDESTIEVIDVAGKIVYSTTGNNEIPIKLESIAPGIYTIRLKSGTLMNTKKIVII